MSSNKIPDKPREVHAAREAKKLAKQLAKTKSKTADSNTPEKKDNSPQNNATVVAKKPAELTKSKDEVDRAVTNTRSINSGVSKEAINAQRDAKKAIKQTEKLKSNTEEKIADVTVRGVADTLKDIANVAKEVQEVAAKVGAMQLDPKKTEESKSKSELRAERRAKQEAQRAAKQATKNVAKQETFAVNLSQKATPSGDAKSKQAVVTKSKEEKTNKSKTSDKLKTKNLGVRRDHWFHHLNTEHLEKALQNIQLNSTVHPAIVRLAVQQATRVLDDPDARLVALLDALKKMIMDVSVGARAETGRALETALSGALRLLAALRPAAAAQRNAVAYLRYQITRLPHNVPEHEAKQRLIEEIDTYISEQVDKAGQTISETVRSKICDGDNVLTYGSSSLVERILIEAWQAGRRFHTIVVGGRTAGSAALATLERLVERGLPATYLDITALSFAMKHTHKVVVGCWALLATGGVVGVAGTASVALAARACNVPLLAACPTARCSARAHTDAFTHNELGPPEQMLEANDSLSDWRQHSRLSLVNLSYDVTPGALVTAVVTECAVLPCTSAPSVLRIKLAEYDLYASTDN